MKARADDRSIFDRDAQPQVLSIQESKGLDAQEITEALNQPLGDNAPVGDIIQTDITHLIDLFEHGKTFGSLIRVPELLAEKLPAIAQRVKGVIAHGGMFEQAAARTLKPLMKQARLLAAKHSSVAMNPPYMGTGGMTKAVKAFGKEHYPHSRSDLFAMFIERGCGMAADSGMVAMITMQSWMFLSSFAELRRAILHGKTLQSMSHLGPRAFSSISGEVVTVTAFVLLNRPIETYRPIFLRLVDGNEQEKARALTLKHGIFATLTQQDFDNIPGMPVAYWIGPKVRDLFRSGELLRQACQPLRGVETGNNERFLKAWVEVNFNRVGIGCEPSCIPADKKWFPYNKGGDFCKWYGNRWLVIDWENDGFNIKNQPYPKGSRLPWRATSSERYFHTGVTWGGLSSANVSFRLSDYGAIFDSNKGAMVFPGAEDRNLVLGLLNSNIAATILGILNPTLSTQNDDVGNIPFAPSLLERCRVEISTAVSECIRLSKAAEADSETCWDFHAHPVLLEEFRTSSIAQSYQSWRDRAEGRREELHALEEQNNRVLIATLGLEEELSPTVPKDHITLYLPDRELDIQRLISYAVGCMMGRYSLDEPGLIYAHSGNEGFEPSKYEKFLPDEDGIVPLTEFHWFEDDASKRFETFIATAWPDEHLQENLQFVAESLGAKKGESPRETIRRYLSTGFFKHHMKLYKKRPIYWLFCSGNHRGFQALVYLHRYNEGTLARMRTEYVIPLLGKIVARIKQLTDDIAGATSTPHRKRLEKEKSTLTKQLAEVQAYDEKLRHYADQRITLDLDDGVKVNYAKFGDLLAEVKAITGKKAEAAS